MKQTIITLSKGQYLSDIEPFKSSGIPSNCICHKEIPGCGVTTFEILYAMHNSVVFEPNVPVIKGKVEEHNAKYPNAKILGVYKCVDVYDIQAYLLSDVKYKKILTTPEGFHKIVKAFGANIDKLLGEYFALFDECCIFRTKFTSIPL